MLRLETEFIVSDIQFSKWDDRGLIGITSDTFQTKYVGQLTYWRLNDEGQLDEVQSIALQTGGIAARESSGYSSFVYTAHTDPILRLWSLNDLRKPIKRYNFHDMSIEDLQVSPFDSEEFASCSKDSTLALWTMADSEPIWATNNESSFPMLGVAYHPQNPSLFLAAPLYVETLASAVLDSKCDGANSSDIFHRDCKIEMYSKEDRKKIYTIMPPDDIIFSCMSISPYNEFLMAVADENGHVYLWDLRRLKKPIDHWQAHALAVSGIKFNPHDEKLLGTGSTDSHFHVWYVEQSTGDDAASASDAALAAPSASGKSDDVYCLKSFKTHNLPITCWDWSVHELGLVVDGGADYSIFMWNFVEHESTASLPNSEDMRGIVQQDQSQQQPQSQDLKSSS